MWGHQSSDARAPKIWCPLCSWLIKVKKESSQIIWGLVLFVILVPIGCLLKVQLQFLQSVQLFGMVNSFRKNLELHCDWTKCQLLCQNLSINSVTKVHEGYPCRPACQIFDTGKQVCGIQPHGSLLHASNYCWILQFILSVHKLLQLIMGEFGSQSHSELEGLLEAPELF